MCVGVRGAASFVLTDADDRDLEHAQPDGATDTVADADHVTVAEPDGISDNNTNTNAHTNTNTLTIAVADRDDRRARSVLRGRRCAHSGARLRATGRDRSRLDAHAATRI